MTKDKSFYRRFFALAGALMLEQAVVLSVNLADNVMIGNYWEMSLAGVAAVNQVQFVLQQIIYGVANGVIVLGSQYWAKQNREAIQKLCNVALKLGMLLAMAFFLVATLFPRELIGLFVKDADAISEGCKYLNIIRFTYPVFAITTVLLGSMRSVENVRLALGVSVVSLCLNCSINYLLIGGNLGCPRMGVEGAAIGTLTARVVEVCIVSFVVFSRDKKLQLRMKHLGKIDPLLGKDYMVTALPILAAAAMWGFSNAAQTVILGHLSTNAMTAYSMSSTVYLLLKVAAVGSCTAASIIVGKQVGMGDMTVLKSYVRTLQVLFLGVGAVLSLGLMSIRVPLFSLYTVSETTYELANQFLMFQSLTIFTMSYQMPTNAGIIRGGGDAKYVMYVDIISVWLIVLPLSFLGAFVFHWSPFWVVVCLNADQIFKAIPAVIYGNSYKWVRNLTR